MGVKFYGPGDHPAGFIGFRVTLAFNDNYNQTYFSTNPAEQQSDEDRYFYYRRLQAEKQNLEWQLESLRYQYHRFVHQNHPTTKPERGVGVHGITASFFRDRRGTWQAGFTVARDQHEDGRRKPTKRFTFCTKPFSQVWLEAANVWADEHEIVPVDRERVVKTSPEPEQFKRLRRQMNEHDGFDIPVGALSAVFAEQREQINQKRSIQRAKELKLGMGMGMGMGIMMPPDGGAQAEMAAWFDREKGSLA